MINRIRITRFALWGLIIFQPAAICLVFLLPESEAILGFSAAWTFDDIQTYSDVQRGLGLGFGLLCTAPYLGIYWRMLLLIDGYAAHTGFTPDHIRAMSQIASLLLLAFIMSLLTPMAASLIGTMHNAPGERSLHIAISSRDLALLTVALFAGLFAQVARATQEKAAELDEIV